MMKKKILSIFMITAILLSFAAALYAGPATAAPETTEAEARLLKPTVDYRGFTGAGKVTDGSYKTYAVGVSEATVAITATEDIGFLYLKFNHAPGDWVISTATENSQHGLNGFIHEYVDVAGVHGDVRELILTFPTGVELTALSVYGKGSIPSDVQVWQPECEKADLMLISAHADDEQLYFSGIIPYYAAVRGLQVQVVFFTEHLEENMRWHERLDAIWINGCRNYPVVSEFPDQLSYSLEAAYSNFVKKGYTEEQIVDWMATLLRRFRPYAAVSHALDGEYGHGQHMAAVDALIRGADRAADTSFVTEGYAAYDLPKLYVHSYEQNPIVLDWIDTPFDELGGKTPFQLSQDGYIAHDSQLIQYNDIKKRFYGTTLPVSHPEQITVKKASQIAITEDPPQYYGLYRKADGVPDDVKKNDFLENMYPLSTDTTTAPETTKAPETVPVTSGEETTVPASDTNAPTVPAETEKQEDPAASSAQFPPLTHEKPHGTVFIVICSLLGGVALGAVLCIGIRKIRHCDNR